MSKCKLFNDIDKSPDINMNETGTMSANKSGIHPALSPQSGTKKNKRPSSAYSREKGKRPRPDSLAEAEGTDSDSMEVPGFFSTSNQKLPYTRKEDEVILKYVLKGQNIFKVSSILLWKHLEAKKDNPKRTYHSLKNRFLRNIKPLLFTKFAHFTKDKTVTERILTKFPELKYSMGRKETLSKIKLPERKPLPRPAEDEKVSSTSTNESQGNIERTSWSQCPNDTQISVIHSVSEPTNHPSSDSFKSVIYKRAVRIESDGISILVNFKSKKYVDIPSLGIFETFLKHGGKADFKSCPTCGRENVPENVNDKELDVIPNSVDTIESSSKCTEKTSVRSKSTNKTTSTTRRTNSEPYGSRSPSLLSDVGESGETDKRTTDNRFSGNNKVMSLHSEKNTSTSSRKASQKSISPTPGEKADSNTSRNKIVRVAAASTSKSNNETDLGTWKRRRDSDEDLDSICEDAMANFRKLIDYEEEQQLVRKCLNRNFKSIGLEEISQSNWDAYFLESSSDMDTPPLTIDCDTDSQKNESGEQSRNTRSSDTSTYTKTTLSGKKKKS